MKTTTDIDKTKLLGFDLKGEPIFDIVVPARQDGAETRAVGADGKAVGAGAKAGGLQKLPGDAKIRSA